LLSVKVNEIMNNIKSHYNKNTPQMPLSSDEPTFEKMLHGSSSLVAMTQESIGQGVTNERMASMEMFAKCIVTNNDVRQEIEPMVALLETYAQARLNEEGAEN
jgi:hypothetical protein